MSDKDPLSNTSRRVFLRNLLSGIGSGLLLAASAKVSAQDPTTHAEATREPASAGYRETDHIRAYYDSARF